MMKHLLFLSLVKLNFHKIDTAMDKYDANFMIQTNDLENTFNTKKFVSKTW